MVESLVYLKERRSLIGEGATPPRRRNGAAYREVAFGRAALVVCVREGGPRGGVVFPTQSPRALKQSEESNRQVWRGSLGFLNATRV